MRGLEARGLEFVDYRRVVAGVHPIIDPLPAGSAAAARTHPRIPTNNNLKTNCLRRTVVIRVHDSVRFRFGWAAELPGPGYQEPGIESEALTLATGSLTLFACFTLRLGM